MHRNIYYDRWDPQPDEPEYFPEEVAEVVNDNGKHILVHASCMKEGEQIA